jgi:hypothetical protein
MKRYVNEEMELRVVARTGFGAGGESGNFRKGERGYGARSGSYTREM